MARALSVSWASSEDLPAECHTDILAFLKTLRTSCWAVVAAACLGGSIRLAFSDTVLLQPSSDTTLFESSPGDNMGGWTHVSSGTTGSAADRTRNRGLFRFDVAGALPNHAKITRATLNLYVVRVPGDMGGGRPASSNFLLHRVSKPWGEGNKLGDRGFPADPDEATWNYRFAPNSKGVGGVTWTAPGAASSVDFSPVVSASQSVSGQGPYEFGSSSNLVADVQTWLNDPSSNFGWILISQSENTAKTARGFGSREDRDHPPILAVEYVTAAAPRIERVEKNGGKFELLFGAEAGQSYVVQFRSSLSVAGWLTLTNINAQAVSTNILVSDPISLGQRFYRIVKP